MTKSLNEILSLVHLKIGYGAGGNQNLLLSSASAGADRGELIALIGRNGTGKSTLLRTITGLQLPVGGNIFFGERSIEDYSRTELALKVGYISTEIVRVSNMRVYDLVALGRYPHTSWVGKIGPSDNKAISDALEMTSMTSFAAKYISELSDGERQKAMIARILAQDTDIMVMDEPTAFLDIAGKYEILRLMKMLTNEKRKTIIFSTHDLQIAINQSDRIWLITGCELIEGAPEDLMIAGAFDHIFDSSSVVFDSENGTFSFRNETHSSIYIEGEGDKRRWTERAIGRAGFMVSDTKKYVSVTIPSDNNSYWLLKTASAETRVRSLGELIKLLRQNEMLTI